MYFKRILATVSAVAMLIATTSLSSISTVSATDAYATSGTWGSDGKWVLSDDGTLTVTGTGELGGNHCLTPNLNFVKDVERLVVGEGITSISDNFTGNGQLQSANVAEIVLPSTLSGEFSFYLRGSSIKDVYIYSKNISVPKNNSGILPYPDSGIVLHLYKDSDTEKCFRNLYDYTDKDIEYIEGERLEEPEPVPAVVPELTEISGPAGLASKWEWSEANKTLTFSGKGSITIDEDYKKYSATTEHVIIESGITHVLGNANMTIQSLGGLQFGAFSGFTKLQDVQLSETIKEIAAAAFYNTPLTSIKLPSTLEKIGDCAFQNTNIEGISFPDSLINIGESAFANTNIKSINLHENMTIGGASFNQCESLTEVTIPKNVTFSLTRIGGMGMARENAAFSYCSGLEKVIFADGSSYTVTDTWGHVKGNGIAGQLFIGCTSLKTVIIRDANIDYIANDTFDTTNNPKFYVINSSTTEQTLRDAGYLTDENTVYLATEDSIDELDEAIERAESIDTSNCIEDTIVALNEAIDAAKTVLDKYNSEEYSDVTLDEVNEAIQTLNDAIDNLKYLPADYTAVDEAIATIPTDLSKYTDESVKALNDALSAVNRDLDINSQDTVDGYAKAIEDAIKGLVEKTIMPSSSQPTSSSDVKPTTNPTTATTRSPSQVAKDKSNAEKIMKQAKITKLKAKSKSKKKITVTWKKVKKAVGYQVQVSTNKKFKKGKIIFDKHTKKNTLKISNKKIKSKKIYYVRVRAYATYKDTNGKLQKVYSSWIKKTRKVKVK